MDTFVFPLIQNSQKAEEPAGQVNTTVTNYQIMTNILFQKFRIPELWPHLVEISPPTSGNIFYASVSY